MPSKFLDLDSVSTIRDLVHKDIKSEAEKLDSAKQDTISDLDTIRSGASAGATAIQQNDLEAYHDSSKQDKITDSVTLGSTILDETTLNRLLALLPPLYPSKGDLITMDLDGTERTYRVISINGSEALLLGLFKIGSNTSHISSPITFPDNTQGYSWKDTNYDTALNTTWYNLLNSQAKEAIIEQNRIATLWKFDDSGDPTYIRGRHDGSTNAKISKTTQTYNLGSKNIFPLTIQEIIDYLEVPAGDTITWQSIYQLFWNDISTQKNADDDIALGDSAPSDTTIINAYRGDFGGTNISSCAVVPAFVIDLSKIDFDVVTE